MIDLLEKFLLRQERLTRTELKKLFVELNEAVVAMQTLLSFFGQPSRGEAVVSLGGYIRFFLDIDVEAPQTKVLHALIRVSQRTELEIERTIKEMIQ